ncbi:MAG: metallophosphoesterase [Methanomassiliicoccales archaeon]
MSMRLLVISDIHGRERAIEWSNRRIDDLGLDAVLVLGDITNFGPAEWAKEFLESLNAPAYALPGNCDPPEVEEWIGKSATPLHGRKVEIGGEIFIGLGGSNPTIFDTPNEMSEEEIQGLLEPVMEEDAIMACHPPMYGVLDVPPDGPHTGSTALKGMVERYPPKALLSGHIHEERGLTEKDGIIFMNPGAAKDSYAGMLELGDDVTARLLDRME